MSIQLDCKPNRTLSVDIRIEGVDFHSCARRGSRSGSSRVNPRSERLADLVVSVEVHDFGPGGGEVVGEV
ncbi:hypothetical protein, partial [Saccharopolyspora halophila]|uniref:hypothetical protein n=1 Tax=Saccharopolyspora halophila TaxID=405551 RepID=UPI0031E3469B